jgi:ABC-type multidrug transport system ATPase subunit
MDSRTTPAADDRSEKALAERAHSIFNDASIQESKSLPRTRHDSSSFHSAVSRISQAVRDVLAPDPAGTQQRGQIELRPVARVDLHVKDLTVTFDRYASGLGRVQRALSGRKQHDTKDILRNVCASMPRGSLTAILGASGSGKTSFLNLLSHRMQDSRMKVAGDVRYNGSPNLSSVRSAYVMQQDVLLSTLTVRETLRYAAELRLPPPTTAAERRSIVEEVILELGLSDCSDTRIGNNVHKGCSGGEKRRTSLGVQLLANPSLIFLDEVTTGLDAASAFLLVKTLKQLADRGRNVVITIHQPRSEIWELFDHVVLLSGGEAIYSGPRASCLDYFEDLNYPIPPFVNPAEHIVDLAAVDTRTPELENISSLRVDGLKEAWRQASVDFAPAHHPSSSNDPPARNAGFVRQVWVQTHRALKTTSRDPFGVAGSMVECFSMGILTGWIFLNLGRDLSGIRSREGALYTASALQGYLILLFETYRLTLDIGVFDRERAEGVVGVLSFLLSRRLARLFLEDIPIPFVYSIIFYFMSDLRRDAGAFFVFFAITLLSQFCAVCFAMLAVSCSRDFAGASLIANINFTLQSMCSGFFVQSNQIPIYVRWLKYTAYAWYANGALINNEFIGGTSDPQGQFYDCPYPFGAANPACAQYTGAFIVDSFGIPRNQWIWRPMVVLASYSLAFYLGAWFIFTVYKVDVRTSRERTSTIDLSVGKETLETRSLEDVRTLSVNLDQLSLNIRKKGLRKQQVIPVLKPITATFEPGVLNVVMGVSGGGKTTLLNLLAGRLESTLTTRYERSGSILFGGSTPAPDVVKSVVSYVAQTDDALLPTLTVRETLYFAAQLRLPRWMSKADKAARAEDVLLKLGLRDCANNLVGNDLVKGISGGEKRRVSIAIQILTNPKICLLDEPTSGLDAFTASSIIEVLRGLAEEGRTIIMTIHQSRSDLFPHFSNVLLLARGGYMVYAGLGQLMLPYFAQQGFLCPEHVNPADFALDLIATNARQNKGEKVNSLVTHWRQRIPLRRGISHISSPAELGTFRRDMTPFWVALPLLVRRSLTSFRRDSSAILARTSQVIAFGVIITLFFAPLKSDYNSIQSRFGFIQEYLALYFVGMLQNVAVYPFEKVLFYSEFADAAYSPEAFFVCYTLLEFPFELVTSLVFGVLVTFAAKLPYTATVFFVNTFNCFAIVNCGESIGIMFNTLFASTGFAVNLTSTVLSISLLMAGVISTNLAGFLSAFNHLSPAKWSIGNLAPYTIMGLTFTCTPEQQLPNGQCPISTGEQALKLYNLDTNGWQNLVALAVTVVAYRMLAYLLLRLALVRWDTLSRRKHKQAG